MKLSIEASNRAWMAPHLLQLQRPIKAGEDVQALLYYGNIGRSPAIHVGNHSEGTVLPLDSLIDTPKDKLAFRLRDAIRELKMPDSCKFARNEQFGGAAHPISPDNLTKAVFIEGKEITPQIESGSGYLIVKGCITYETMERQHFSRYCFLYNSVVDKQRPEAHRNYWQRCLTDNEAD